MMLFLEFAYIGSAYHGFQVQKGLPTVCQTLQDAMQNVLGSRPDVKGCSRTDAGVHARMYCLSFFSDTAIPSQKLPLALNAHLPKDIRAVRAVPVADDFHARYSALGKEYSYVIRTSHYDDPFLQGQYYRTSLSLDAQAMNSAAALFVGRQDFAAFMAAGSSVQSTVRTVTKAQVSQSGAWVTFTVAADGFLYNMVRIMAGTLLEVGKGGMSEQQLQDAIQSKQRQQAGQTLPACGLFLNKVFYSGVHEAYLP